MFERKPLIADVVGSSPPVAASNQGESFAVQRNHAVFADSPLPTRTLITAARRSARKVSGRRCELISVPGHAGRCPAREGTLTTEIIDATPNLKGMD
jgi:hypothetical protein